MRKLPAKFDTILPDSLGPQVAQLWNVLFTNTVWRVIFGDANFRVKSEKALRINFRGFKFRDSNQSRNVVLHKHWCNQYTHLIC